MKDQKYNLAQVVGLHRAALTVFITGRLAPCRFNGSRRARALRFR